MSKAVQEELVLVVGVVMLDVEISLQRGRFPALRVCRVDVPTSSFEDLVIKTSNALRLRCVVVVGVAEKEFGVE